ncbi:MAG: hypothetical protein K5905_06805 [Roseibium sp.]|uniref:hypothetical protein n=1 Tax=Roseibium sp. TaxID=1936156 RepID=UPI002620573F|nr:hypothetical protein [Roseibium sp.]MCV0425163.1 hypothetical protein [Roseibium sp.]
MVSDKTKKKISEKLEGGLKELLIDQILPSDTNPDHVTIEKMVQSLDITFDEAYALYYGEGPEFFDAVFRSSEKGMLERIAESWGGVKKEKSPVPDATKDHWREQASIYAKYLRFGETVVPSNKPDIAKSPKVPPNNGDASRPVPRAKPGKVIPKPKRKPQKQDSASANPFNLQKPNLKQQSEIIERNPVMARRMILAEGRDPKLFGFA